MPFFGNRSTENETCGMPDEPEQSAGEHVAGRAHRAVEVEGLHEWFMREARTAAPNPLSMLTTPTPAAQELSIARSAATPLNDAP